MDVFVVECYRFYIESGLVLFLSEVELFIYEYFLVMLERCSEEYEK